MNKILAFIKKEPVLIVACILMIVSAFFVHPNKDYLGYIDFKVLALLFCLMAVVAGFQSQGVFDYVANILTRKIQVVRTLTLVLCVLCFFSAMIITNDVVLITFVPLTLVLLGSVKESAIIRTIVLETVSANLGSMFTPIGNPQNLFLYSRSEYNPFTFCKYMFIPTFICFIFIVLLCFFASRVKVVKEEAAQNASESGTPSNTEAELKKEKNLRTFKLILFSALFIVSLLVVFHVLHYAIAFGIVLVAFLIFDRKTLLKVDYMLLLTFIAFFVFIGNLGHIEIVRTTLEKLLEGRVFYVSILASQVFSNVPAAMLLADFTQDTNNLLLGVNVGGLGTLIASMASLISYKLYAAKKGSNKGLYMGLFTAINFGMLIVLTLLLPFVMKFFN